MTTSRSARTKQIRLDAEQLIQQSAMKWTILRPTMIHGVPGDRNLSRLLTPLRRVPVLPVPGGGQHIQQPVHVHVADLAEAVLAAAERPAATGTSYDVAGPAPLTFADLLRTSARPLQSPGDGRCCPAKVESLGGWDRYGHQLVEAFRDPRAGLA